MIRLQSEAKITFERVWNSEMVQLVTQPDVRSARQLEFCYLCGKPFANWNDNHPDHVPPEALFALCDRNFPIKVAAHLGCNQGNSVDDEIIGQLVAVIHGKVAPKAVQRLEVRPVDIGETGCESLASTNIDIPGQIFRWVRGFHAALYQHFLPVETRFCVYPPFPTASLDKDGNRVLQRLKKHQAELVLVIKRNRAANAVDRIKCNNGKLTYECIWSHSSSGMPICAFALNIYDWKRLGDGQNFRQRGCVGCYTAPMKPVLASFDTKLEFPIQNREPLDPFGD